MIPKSGVIFTYTPADHFTLPVIEPVLTLASSDEYSTEFDASVSFTEIPNADELITVFEGYSDEVDTSATILRPPLDGLRASAESPTLVPVSDSIRPVTVPMYSDLLQPQIVTQPVVQKAQKRSFPWRPVAGVAFLAAAIIGLAIPLIPKATFEVSYFIGQKQQKAIVEEKEAKPMPQAVPLTFNPLIGPDGKEITPVNTEFSIVIPKVGINAPVIAGVDALNVKDYTQALAKGVAHAKSSYLPDQDGATYLFSHSTNYQWFVRDLNAIFYNVKNLTEGDLIVVFYKGNRYTYTYKNKAIVAPSDTTYLLPITGKKMLILQTCWPPGTTENRLLIFADLIEEKGIAI
jgi:LPXTG-site transpeptidase (sortase) family protein